jgi:flagellar basal-body rod modification protein FlgD
MSSVSPINGSSQSSGGSSSSSSSAATGALGTPNENMFLKLLVTQLKNQDPLNPSDGTQFLSQLAQFSSLEQLTQISTNTAALAKTTTTASTTTNQQGK